MVEHVQQRARKSQYRNPGIAAALADKPGTQPHNHEAHVFYTGIGQQTLEVALGRGFKNTHKCGGKAQNQQGPAPPFGGFTRRGQHASAAD